LHTLLKKWRKIFDVLLHQDNSAQAFKGSDYPVKT